MSRKRDDATEDVLRTEEPAGEVIQIEYLRRRTPKPRRQFHEFRLSPLSNKRLWADS